MKRPASLLIAIILFLMATAQLIRFLLGIPVTAAGQEIPVWPSAPAAAALSALAVWLLHERNNP
ncbi:MAG TPA: hypothetical protein P5238_09345 [Smithellaceae bacterium]|nr:hypothetical protein [Smithellaceae bacterium]HRS83679.1 hypothetical protein [Smithellaceae bacterium]HRV43708.1 hypothetical protein [Smithellaceae bacterium]